MTVRKISAFVIGRWVHRDCFKLELKIICFGQRIISSVIFISGIFKVKINVCNVWVVLNILLIAEHPVS